MARRFYSNAQRLLVPGLQNSQYLYKERLITALQPETRWLDLGCGHQVLPDWMPNADDEQTALVRRCRIAVGIDADHWSLQQNALLRNKFRGDIERLPLADGSFDLVTANVVLEHVRDPRALLLEVHRVLKPGGRFLFHTPNSWGYTAPSARLLPAPLKLKLAYLLQRRKEEDAFPAFYRFNTAGTVRRLANQFGSRVAELRHVESSAQTFVWAPWCSWNSCGSRLSGWVRCGA